jgi:hypothetical protein
LERFVVPELDRLRDDPAAAKLPGFARVFAWVIALFFGSSLLITLVMMVIIPVVAMQPWFGPNQLSGTDILSLTLFGFLLVVQTVYSVVFFSSSIGVLRRRRRAVRPFRVCLWIFNGYMVLGAIFQIVLYWLVRPPDYELVLAVIPLFSGVTIIVAWLSARMFRILSTQTVADIMR